MSKIIMAIDPGNEQSAYVFLVDGRIADKGKVDNEALLKMLTIKESAEMGGVTIDQAELVVEWIQGYGMTVGQSVFDTCLWVGRFVQAWGKPVDLMPRKAVKSHICNNTSAKDQHVREALIDRMGPQGTKRQPGPLFGVTGDILAALAVAVTYADGVQGDTVS